MQLKNSLTLNALTWFLRGNDLGSDCLFLSSWPRSAARCMNPPDFTRRHLTRPPGELQSAQGRFAKIAPWLGQSWAKLSHVPIGTESQWPQSVRWRSRYRKFRKLSDCRTFRSLGHGILKRVQQGPCPPAMQIFVFWILLTSFNLSLSEVLSTFQPFSVASQATWQRFVSNLLEVSSSIL